MLSFDPNEYRQRLNLALGIRDPNAIGAPGGAPKGPAKIENPYDVEEQQAPVQPQQQPQQAGPNLGAMVQKVAGGMPGLGGGSGSGEIPGLIDESGAMGGQPVRRKADGGFNLPMGDNGKIQTRPPDLEAEVDPGKLGQAKTIDEVFDAAAPKTQSQYMDWWEKSYGSINEKYDAMREQLGQYQELPEKLSKKQMFTLLLGYGARMMTNMRVGRNGGSGDIDPMAASDDAFTYGQDVAMGNRMSKGEYSENLGAIENARARDLKAIGTKGEAMDKASEIAYRDAQRMNLGKSKGERVTAADGLVYVIEGESAKPVMGPGGKQLRGQLTEKGGDNSEFERAKQSYLQAHGYDANGKKLTGAAWKKVEQAANDFARYGSRQKDDADTNLDDLRAQAKDRVNTIMRSSPDTFRGLEPDELNQKLGELEEREFQRLKRTNLGSSPVHNGPRAAAPKRSEDYVRKNPVALEDFVADYGYVPEGMEEHVTPAIKQRMGL